MKKYKKNKYKGKVLQIRLSNEECEEITKTIKRFNVTRREFILAIKNEVANYNVVRDGEFWESNQQYAWEVRDKHSKKITEKTVCEICGKKNNDSKMELIRHHHYGYEGENAYNVNIVCRRCHGRMHSNKYKNMSFEEASEEERNLIKRK